MPLDQASMAHAVEANLFAFFQQFSSWPKVTWCEEPSCSWAISDLPFPLFNSVIRARFSDEGADAAIEARVGACEARCVPLLWWTGPSTTPADLGARLIQRGFLIEPAHGMIAELSSIDFNAAADARLAIEPVLDRPMLAQWTDVLCEAFGAPQAFGAAFGELAQAFGLGPRSSFQHFLGFWNGVPVATCSLFTGAGVAGIYDVATLPERRRHGIAAAMTRTALAAAASAGYRRAILHSSPLGAGVYRRIGFIDVCDIGQYVWIPEAIRR